MVRAVFDLEAALSELGGGELGDKRRTARLVHTARLLAQHAAGRSLPDRLPNRCDYEGALNLVNNPHVTHQAILQPHLDATRRRMAACGPVVLIIHDTCEYDYSGQRSLALGPIGNGGGQGYEGHNSLALDPESGDLLGLTSQILHVRDSQPQIDAQRAARDASARKRQGKGGRRPDETVAESRSRPSRESRLWIKGCQASPAARKGQLYVDVCDRGSDTFEFIAHQTKHKRSFVIRSTHSRALEEVEGEDEGLEAQAEEGGQPHLLHELLRSLPGVMSWSVEVQANKKQPARTAVVSMAWKRVWLKAPHVRRGEYDKGPIQVWAIRVWEVCPPVGAERLEWLLLTNVPVSTDEEARPRVGWYEWRPRVEEYHKGQKTGMGIEGLQLQSRAGLEPLIGLLSILAVVLVNLRQQARQEEAASQPARQVVDPLWVDVLSVRMFGQARDLSLREFVFALARLGGYMNRCRDAFPGWIVLWRGLTKLLNMVEYELARGEAPPTSPEL